MIEWGLAFLAEYAAELGAGAAAIAILEYVFAPFRSIRKRLKGPEQVRLSQEDRTALLPTKPKDGPALTVPEFIRLRRELKADLELELVEASDEEKSELRARIVELESQIANPDKALADALKRIKDLEALLDRSGNDIGGDRINAAKAALKAGDDAKAKDIFEEIKARQQMAVQESARASYGLGEIAEAAVKWADAAAHYREAANLDPSYRTLSKAHEFTHWAGNYDAALPLGEAAVKAAEAEGGGANLAMAKNDLGLTLKALGDIQRAETLSKEAIELAKSGVGRQHIDYTTFLNSYAYVLLAKSDFSGAERCLNEVLEIEEELVGKNDLRYATTLNNMSSVLLELDRFSEAEALSRQSVSTRRALQKGDHPSIAIALNTLARAIQGQDRLEEAEIVFREALDMDVATVGDRHYDYGVHLNNLALCVEMQGRLDDAEDLYRQSLDINLNATGGKNPEYAVGLSNLGDLLFKSKRPKEAYELWEQARSVFEATLPEGHPATERTKYKLTALNQLD